MKKILLSLLAIAAMSTMASAQAPAQFNYQGIARNSSGAPLASKTLGIRITIHDGSASGTPVYQETQSVTTNPYGLYNLAIGGGTVVTGTMTGIAWGAGSKFVQIEIDPAGGTAYADLGASQLLSVPYSLYSATSPAPTLTLTGSTLTAGANNVTLPTGPTYIAGTGITVSSGGVISANNLAGDVTGAPNANTVTKIQGTAVSSTAPTTGQALVYNGTSWAPATSSSSGITGSGTTNYLPRFTSSSALGNSMIYQATSPGNKLGINTTAPLSTIELDNSTDSMALYISSSYSGSQLYGLARIEDNSTSTTNLHAALIATSMPSTSVVAGTGVLGFGGNVGVRGQGQCGSSSTTATVFGTYGLGYNNADAIGAYGQANAYSTTGTGTKYGVYGVGVNGATNYAGYFSGNVSITGSLAKGSGTFKIDHPLDPDNKYLYHSFVESPDMMNIYNGNISTDAQGFATVTMPAYFDALNKDFRYQLTVIGTFAQAIVKEKMQGNQFVIQTNVPNVEVSWQVTGVRKDAYANAHRVKTEVEKEAQNKGKYLHPVELGKPLTSEINYDYNHPKIYSEDKDAQRGAQSLKK